MSSLQAVIDTNVCLDLFVFHDSRCQLLLKMLMDKYIYGITRPDCREEWIRVLDYKILSLNKSQQQKYISQYDNLISCLKLEKKDSYPLPLCKDKDDQKFLELAYSSRANYLITKDKALLKLKGKIRKKDIFCIIKPEELQII